MDMRSDLAVARHTWSHLLAQGPPLNFMKKYYEHAGITIYHGDCRDILPQLEPCDLVLTDPPYGIGFAASPTKWSRDNIGRKAEGWDDEVMDVSFLLKHCSSAMIWGGNHFDLPPSRGWLVWAKPPGLPSYGTAELCWTNIDMTVRHLECDRCNGDKYNHPTQKPLPLMKWCLTFAPDAQTVLDPFCGTGTTLVAAKNLGKEAIGIEIEEKYCEIAAKRLSQEVFDFSEVKP
jgi:site-specific DNA-methyltransferase (adenine-specific)